MKSLILFILLLPLTSMASIANTVKAKADSCFNECNYNNAIIYYKEALKSLDQESIEEKCEIYIRLGHLYKVTENYEEAFLVFYKILILEKRIKNPDLSLRAKIGYAELLRSVTECDKALEVLNSIDIQVYEDKLPLTTLAEYYDRYAAILNQCYREMEGALKSSGKALAAARKSKSAHHIATSLNEIGYIVENSKSVKEAIPYYKEALELWDTKQYRRYSSNACLNLSRCYNKIGVIDSALFFVNKGLMIVGDDDWNGLLVPLYLEKASCLTQMGKWKEAYEVRLLYHESVMDLRNNEWTNSMASVKGELEIEKKELQITKEQSKFQQAKNDVVQERKTSRFLIFIIGIGLFFVLISMFYFVKTKRLNSHLKNTLVKNEILLKEVHHRVKNNMQVVSSLLDLQSGFTTDKKAKAALVNSRDRINSLALAHQNLYVDDALDSIDIKNYLEALIHSVIGDDILMHAHIDHGYLEIDKAQALGFVLNELLTNSIKHAWSNDDKERLIWVKLIKGEDDWSFYYSDNGVGVADKTKFLESPTFGITLIRSFLKRNLKVSISFGEKPGMNIGFTFK